LRPAYLYILASKKHGTLYVGVATDLRQRLRQHRSGVGGSFTGKYGVRRLVYFERHQELAQAQTRERRIKRWRRAWKIELIETVNPLWRELAAEIPYE
jgi:putative endonuclease